VTLGKSVQRCPETHRSAKLHGRSRREGPPRCGEGPRSARARLTGRERRFLDAGVAVRDAEERRGRERARRFRQLGAVVVALGALAVVSTVAALVRRPVASDR
jgi:hypothetical protein